MITYLIKSTLIIGILLIFYHVFLEKEKMHAFNRFFLLSGLVLAFVAPLISVGYVEIIPVDTTLQLIPPSNELIVQNNVVTYSAQWEWSSVLFAIYLAGASLILIRFLYNLIYLLVQTFNTPIVHIGDIRLVLLQEKVIPHTFFNYVFVNEVEYQNDQIEESLYTHEFTHAQQYHSFDIILIECLQIIYWFNPLIYLYKRAIQLNHEFLADQAVVESQECVPEYQKLLIDKASSNRILQLASNLNFSVTKKRLKMMTHHTSKKRTTIFTFATIPLFVALLMLFGNQSIAQTESLSKASRVELAKKDKHFANTIVVFIQADGSKIIKPYSMLSDNEKAKIVMLPPPPPNVEGANVVTEPLPKGSTVEIHQDDRVTIRLNGAERLPPPPPAPAPPKAPKSSLAPPTPPSPPSPPAPNSIIAPPAPHAPAPPAPNAAPAPPPPPSTLDFVIKKAKEGASFFINGKPVSNEEAIAAVKSSKVMNINTNTNDGKAVVHLKTQ